MLHDFYLCECGDEAILLRKINHDEEIYLSIFCSGQFRQKPSLWQRLVYCWYHLKTGKKYEDQIILSFENARRMSRWLALRAQ